MSDRVDTAGLSKDEKKGKRGNNPRKDTAVKDAIQLQHPSDASNGGNWVVVANEVNISIAFNF